MYGRLEETYCPARPGVIHSFSPSIVRHHRECCCWLLLRIAFVRKTCQLRKWKYILNVKWGQSMSRVGGGATVEPRANDNDSVLLRTSFATEWVSEKSARTIASTRQISRPRLTLTIYQVQVAGHLRRRRKKHANKRSTSICYALHPICRCPGPVQSSPSTNYLARRPTLCFSPRSAGKKFVCVFGIRNGQGSQ